MTASSTRRSFLQKNKNILAVVGLARGVGELDAADARAAVEGEDYYDKLGVTKVINAAGTYTFLTASTMPASVQAAVGRAVKHPVRLAELQQKAGEYLAKRLRCEAAMVTAGAASALTLGTAACMTVGTQAAQRLPTDLMGLKNEVIIQKSHHYQYDHALKNCGIRFVEVEDLDDYKKAFNERTAVAHFFNAAEHGLISREDWVGVAHSHGVPAFNDAAADVPPISNLWKYTQMGFDLVTFSGGKGIRGPQNAGLLLGRRALIEAAAASNNPHEETIGRGMKVAKEQIVGMVAAVDWFLSQSDEEMDAEFRRRADRIAAKLRDLPGIETRIAVPPVANRVPHLLIRCDPEHVKMRARDIAEELRRGSPSIELHLGTGTKQSPLGLPSDEYTLVVGVWMLQPGEDVIVARRLHKVLARASV